MKHLFEEKYNWASVDMSLPNKEIAKLLGCDPSTVSWYKKRNGLRTGRDKSSYHTARLAELDIDWANLNNWEISEKYGIPLPSVASYRGSRKLPKAPFYVNSRNIMKAFDDPSWDGEDFAEGYEP